ncbi:MAG: TonB-dependent receptor [Sphingomonadaceae bacterium]
MRTQIGALRPSTTALATALLFAATAFASPALAQDAEPASGEAVSDEAQTGVADIVVTAQRRSESAQRVPIAISALGSATLDKIGFKGAADVVAAVPSVQVQEIYGRYQPIFSIRGVSQSAFTANQSSPVGVYSDEVYIGETYLHGANFFDVERVEVLKGPQGTLYGKNTTAGAINLISRAPKIDDGMHGNALLGYGTYQATTVEAGIEGTLVPGKLAVRMAGTFNADEGYQHVINLNKRAGQNRGWGLRATAVLEPVDNLSFTLRYTWSKTDQTPNLPRAIGLYPVGPGGSLVDLGGYGRPASYGPRDFDSDLPDQRVDINFNMVSLTSKLSLPAFDIVSVTAYHSSQKYFLGNLSGGDKGVDDTLYNNNTRAFSQDLRLVTTGDSNLKVIAGLYYGYERNAQRNAFWLYQQPLQGLENYLVAVGYDSGTAAYIADFYHQFGNAEIKQTLVHRSYAAYSEAHWEFAPKFDLTVGLRYTHDKDSQPYYNVSRYASFDGPPIGSWIPGNITEGTATRVDNPFDAGLTQYLNGPYSAASAPFLSVSNNRVTGKVTLDYKPTDHTLVYATYSRGYRSGNFNAGLHYLFQGLNQGAYASPETINAYEVGFKSELFDRSLRLNGALFQYDYKNQQFEDVQGISSVLVNAGKSRLRGAELEVVLAPVAGLQLSLSGLYLDAKYRELTLQGHDLAGNTMISSPEWSGTAAVDYTVAVSETFDFGLHLDANTRTHQWYNAFNGQFNNQNIGQAGYTLVNGRLSLRSKDGYEVALWVKNLFDKQYVSYAINIQSAFGMDYLMDGPPRTFGASISYRF